MRWLAVVGGRWPWFVGAGAGQIAPQAVRAELQNVTRAVLSAAAKKGVRMTHRELGSVCKF